jgi:predicted nucleic acid-binding protein
VSKNVSFVDCTNIALMREAQAQYIFSFDGIYKQYGCLTVEDLLAS